MSVKDNHIRLTLSEDEKTVQLTIQAASPEKAMEYYLALERLMVELTRVDLELDWQ
jgi:hypothetical protein